MNPQRIEEFRKKLREGRRVNVVEGVVTVDGAPADPTAPGANAQNPAAGQGVQVKPHEWGHS
ncbi:MAG: hypothetical protein IPM54_38310 [Polyangiaceae bacterium]|nr:hypothetical protein [Polyangiaceae bacterium]